ncbi:MAG: hypothetical protein JOY60_03295 [Burkholderiaceae bacterium]|nr:hypothetical protein [Roseateles sp.]MBV8468874.1 hypothetical protein [Burkholderiaceae bacterium]
MKHILTAVTLAAIGSACFAADNQMQDSAYQAEQALRSECASQHAVNLNKSQDQNEYVFVYAKSEYRGEYQAGHVLGCSEGQYAAYLNSADPMRVMAAYPTAAGRASSKAQDGKPASGN